MAAKNALVAVSARPPLAAGEPARPGRLGHLIVITATLGAFGPYIVGSVRTEQIVVYGLLVVMLPYTASRLRVDGGMKFLIPWGLYILIASLGAIFPAHLKAQWATGNVLAGLDNVMLPMAVMLIVWSAIDPRDATKLFEISSRIVIVAVSANGILALLGTRIDLTYLLRPFWTTESSATTVAELAASNGRLGGIFNQPAEAGVFYSIAGLLAVYLWSQRPARLTVVLTLIVIGGMLSVTKVFILGGLPLILYYWWSSRRGNGKLVVVALALFGSAGVALSGLLEQWTGLSYLTRLLNPPGGGWVAFYSAGRFDSGSFLSQVISEVLLISPISGVGASGWLVPYDNGWVEALVFAGLLGTACYSAVLAGMFALGARTTDGRRRQLTFLVALFLVGASLGLPALTANRASTVVWLLIALLVLAARSEKALRDPLSLSGQAAYPVVERNGLRKPALGTPVRKLPT